MANARQQLNFNVFLSLTAGTLPRAAIAAILRHTLADTTSLALCMHRVADDPADEHRYRVRSEVLDSIIEALLSARKGRRHGWLTVTFDDGYDDAAQYVATRARLFADVEFLLFVCPEKTLGRAGFRWDLPVGGLPRRQFDVNAENVRADLRELADAPGIRLASVDRLRQLASLKNVSLGNHSSLHAIATEVPLALVREDYARSTALFERVWGPQRHFAFPFGTPMEQYDQRHVSALRRLGSFLIWNTQAKPFTTEQRVPGAVLPRFPIVGRRSVDQLLGWVAARLIRDRLLGAHTHQTQPRR